MGGRLNNSSSIEPVVVVVEVAKKEGRRQITVG